VSDVTRVREFPLPDLGEGLTEGEILKWLVAEGDTITLNQPIVEVETAKAAVEIPAKWAGKVARIYQAEGAMVEVGMPIIAIDTDPSAGDLPEDFGTVRLTAPDDTTEAGPSGRTPNLVGYGPRVGAAARRPRKDASLPTTLVVTPPPAPAPVSPPPAVPRPEVQRPDSGPRSDAKARSDGNGRSEGNGRSDGNARSDAKALAKPPVRKLARDLGVDLDGVPGTGPSGSITRDDVHAAANGTPAGVDGFSATVTVPGASFGPDREQRIAVKGVRKLTAENMVASAFTAPHVSEFLTIDVTRTMKAVQRLREQRDWHGVRVSPLLLVAKAVLLAVGRHPMINSCWSAQTSEIVVKDYVNLGIAAATPRGLLVPNIKDAGRLSLRDLADAMTALVATAKEGRTTPADMAGGTFTITNVGVFGVDTGTPILPPGEAAILAFGAVREMPWVHKGQVKPRQVTTLGISFDHRIIDGELGSRFLADVGAFLTDPTGSLLAWS
jgi:2-oxoisovalerate dehydrogenase E2 component (dihydrolipoyl transacylase)